MGYGFRHPLCLTDSEWSAATVSHYCSSGNQAAQDAVACQRLALGGDGHRAQQGYILHWLRWHTSVLIATAGEGRKRAILYMVTPYMDHDLSGLLDNPDVRFSEPQIKCYMLQLFEGLRYLHEVCFPEPLLSEVLGRL